MHELQRTYRGSAFKEVNAEWDEQREHRSGLERAIAVACLRQGEDEKARMGELRELLRTAGARIERAVVQRRDRPDPRTYLGRGRLEDLQELVKRTAPDLVAVESELTPGQQRALEDRLKTRVVDRTGIILDIFAQHASSAEGKLQVELAQLEYSYARQEGLWQHLERLGGGVGTRGPGESQLESDRRLIRQRMAVLRRRLRESERSRGIRRRRRAETAIPKVALAGYTNAGKSSLMNALSGADVDVNDALFQTLDPTTRIVEPQGHRVLLSDTVGFVRDLPHQLVAAFRATLEEVRDADLILHVLDAAEPEEAREERIEASVSVLAEIGAAEVPRLVVLNKIDLVDAERRRELSFREPDAVAVSAVTGEGLDDLRARLADLSRGRLEPVSVLVPYTEGALLSAIHRDGSEVHQESTPEGTRVRALLPPAAAGRVRAALAALSE
ncbi:MAG: GTPase HflX [Miltoncostaeaceae bacterium]